MVDQETFKREITKLFNGQPGVVISSEVIAQYLAEALDRKELTVLQVTNLIKDGILEAGGVVTESVPQQHTIESGRYQT